MKKRGFTLAEVLITLTVLGILIAITIPVINQLTPNKQKIMFKKAYEVCERVVEELINEEGLYPDDTLGFIYTTDAVTYNGSLYSGTTKFCELFAEKLNISGASSCGASGFDFTTNDGIIWDMPTGNFTTGGSQTIIIDVSGGTTETQTRKNPNCRCTNPPTCTGCSENADQFQIYIWNDGRVTVDDTAKEAEYLNSTVINNN